MLKITVVLPPLGFEASSMRNGWGMSNQSRVASHCSWNALSRLRSGKILRGRDGGKEVMVPSDPVSFIFRQEIFSCPRVRYIPETMSYMLVVRERPL